MNEDRGFKRQTLDLTEMVKEIPTEHLRQFKGPDGLLRLQQKWLVSGIPEWRPIKVVTWNEVGIHE